MILIYLDKHTARSEFVFEFIFKEHFEILYKVTNDIQDFENHAGIKINYSTHRLKSGFHIHSNGVLQDNSLKKIDVPVGEKQGTKILFPSINCDLGFDLFSAAFYMLSRYEEYLPFTTDKFGRFKAEDSLAYKNDFLEIPIVDAGIDLLAKALNIQKNNSRFKAVLTYDIDVAYKFLGRNFQRNLGSILRDFIKLNFRNLLQRVGTFLKLRKDPWDIYDELHEMLCEKNLDSVYFFLVGEKTEYDRNLNYNSSKMQSLISSISQNAEIGIHPSFVSNKNKTRLFAEKERLEFISRKKVIKSRQHFLKISFPQTYLNLIEAGIMEDYSMGFPDKAGFRAGTCKPFHFYDLKNELITDLKIFPVTCMEATFIYYDKSPPEKALKKILTLMKTVNFYGGTFVPIWHNENLSLVGNRKFWKKVHDQMVRQISFYLKK